MLFKEYVEILRKHYRVKPSNYAICKELFDSVVSASDEIEAMPDYNKTVVSRILRGERSFPLAVRDHIYDDCVSKSIEDYFDDCVVPKLRPDCSDLIHEMCVLIETYPNISKPHLAAIKAMAKQQYIAGFLAEIFRYSIVEGTTETKKEKTQVNQPDNSPGKQPVLSLCGIGEDGSLVNGYIILDLSDKTGFSKQAFRNQFRERCNEISEIHLEKNSISTDEKIAAISNENTAEKSDTIKALEKKYNISLDKANNIGLPMNRKVEVEEKLKEEIVDAANAIGVELSDDFFDFGALEYDVFRSAAIFGGGTVLVGEPDEKRKYNLLYELRDAIEGFKTAAPFVNAFEGIQAVQLALSNTGTTFDEDISVELSFPKGYLMTITSIAEMNESVYHFIMYDNDMNLLFGIPRGKEYLDYASSEKHIQVSEDHKIPMVMTPFGYSHYETSVAEKAGELSKLFKVFVSENDHDDTISVRFDEILHNEAIAFPTVLLLKKEVSSIKYTIHSRHQASVLAGEIKKLNS